MEPLQRGGYNLGAALGGGDAAYDRGLNAQTLQNLAVGKGQADFAKKVEEARMATGKRVAREGIAAGLRQTLPEDMQDRADGLANIAIGFGTNANDIAGMIGNVQKTIIRSEIAPAYEADGVGRGAALSAALNGTALKTNDIDSGYQLNPYDTGGAANMTQSESAKIGRDDRVASARVANYQEVSGGGGGGSGRKPAIPTYTSPTNTALSAAFGGEGGIADPAKVNEFRAWQLKNAEVDPQYRDGDYAIAAFKAGKNAMRPIEFEGKQYELPAGVDPQVWVRATSTMADLKAAGVPVGPEQGKSIMKAFEGGYEVGVSPTGEVKWIPQNTPAAAKPTPKAVKTPADRAKGNSGQVASGVQAPAPGAKQGRDGNWYIPDPARPGKFLRVDG